MPRVKAKRPDAAQTYVAWMPHATDDHTIAEGTRLRGDHPAVVANPSYFVPDGTAGDERPDVMGALVDRQEHDDPPPEVDVVVQAEPVSYQRPELLRLKRDIRVGVGSNGKGHPGVVREYARGTVFAADSELAMSTDLFERVDG
jgi:hypothetical protein